MLYGTEAVGGFFPFGLTMGSRKSFGIGRERVKPGIRSGSREASCDAERRRSESNRRIADLQSAALPLGHGAVLQS
jgi:hypothetical protein